LVISVIALAVGGCATNPKTPTEGAAAGGLTGAGVGAALGALIGAVTGDPGTGAWIGAAAGGLVGMAAGASAGAENQRRLQAQYQRELSKVPAAWRGPQGEIIGTLRVENNRLFYCLGEDHLVWDAANECWYAED